MTEQLQATVVGLNDLIRVTENGDRLTKAHVTKAVNKSVLVIEGEAKTLASSKGLGATFTRTIHSEVHNMGAAIKGIVGTNDKRGRWFEFGTGVFHEPNPHTPWIVTAVNRLALTIPVGAGGGTAHWAVQSQGAGYSRMFNSKGQGLFRTPKGGSTASAAKAQNVVFRKKVTIKGMKPRPWLMQAFRNKKPEVEMVFAKEIQAVNKELADAARGGR